MQVRGRQHDRHDRYGEYAALFSAAAVRQRCHRLGELALAEKTRWFRFDQTRFAACVDLVAATCRKHYPDLVIPLHSRWRHFEPSGTNLWRYYTDGFDGDRIALARSAVDLVFLSVLLDAGAGEKWTYRDPVTGCSQGRSEGLAAASIDLYFNHVSTFDRSRGWWIDADSLRSLTSEALGRALQHSAHNPLAGIEGRLSLLHGLGEVLADAPTDASGIRRPGALVDECLALSASAASGKPSVDLAQVLEIVLRRFSGMWPDGLIREGLNLGDCGIHGGLVTDDRTSGIVPFHKLSQWLTYSLVEPLQWAGLEVVNADGLTGLPEYRNGGLLIDSGVLQPLDADLPTVELSLDAEAVVEWRALTVFVLDRLAEALRQALDLDRQRLPLGSVLQGGTWTAGRELAARLRPDRSPPLKLNIGGTIF